MSPARARRYRTQRGSLSEKKRQIRATVDAVRDCLGLAPLYGETSTDTVSWLTPLGEGYEEMLGRGGHLGRGHGNGGMQ